MKLLIADKFEQSGREGLAGLGCDVIYEPDLKDDTLVEAIRAHQPEALIVRSTRVTAPMLESGTLALVIRAGAGYNTIDVAAASRCGIFVANCPGKNAIAVAELAFGLILALDRRIPDNVADLRAGVWNKKTYSQAQGLYGKTLGLIGVGNIGKEMIQRARAFGLRVIAWSRSLTSEKSQALGVERCETPLEVAKHADIVSVHVALTPDTRALCNDELFQVMKPGAYFINTSRSEVVDQPALERAVQEKNIRAGLDVFENEPSSGDGAFEDPIARLPGVYGTHHIGASTEQAQEAVAAEVVYIIQSYLQTGKVPNVVNLCDQSPATCLLVARHLDRVGVLAHIFTCLREANINAQETENIVFEGAEAAIARIRLDNAPTEATLNAIRDHEYVLAAHAISLKD